MKILKEIKDEPIPEKFDVREASRAVVFDSDNKIPLLFVSKYNYHKLPGGGIEKGEGKIAACKRELLEETGSTIEITGELGEITEYRSKFNLFQTSYCYIGKVLKKGKLNLMPDEIEEGFELIWVSLEEAIELINNDKPSNYEGKFIKERDLRFLEEAYKLKNYKFRA